jgi:protease IV
MEKGVKVKHRFRTLFIVVGVFFFSIFVLLPLILAITKSNKLATGNVALIPIEGLITVSGVSGFGQASVSSEDIVNFIESANENSKVKVILLEINSPGGSAVASDEIASAVKKSKKPVIALIREAGASGGYWIASAAKHIIANRMSITGSIGVVSSYLEFSGLMDEYGVGYERLVAGERKDLGVPFKKLSLQEKEIFQKKLDRIHNFFVLEVAANRGMDVSDVKNLATGEFFLGVEAFEFGLVDQLGDKDSAKEYIKKNYALSEVDLITYRKEVGLIEALMGIFSDFSFNIGEGLGSIMLRQENSLMLR